MKYHCPDCGRLVADMTGKIRPGTVMICKECDRFEQQPPLASKGKLKADLPPGFEALFGVFRK